MPRVSDICGGSQRQLLLQQFGLDIERGRAGVIRAVGTPESASVGPVAVVDQV